MKNHLCRLLLTTLLLCPALLHSADIEPISLKAFLAKSQFERLNAEWLLPYGPQVINGVPFQVDGIVELYGKGAAGAGLHGLTNIHDIPVGKTFEALHLFAGAAWGVSDDTKIAIIHFQYADGSAYGASVEFGRHVRDWFGSRREAEKPLLDERTKVVWNADFREAGKWDKELRLFYAAVDNPHPEKEVRALSLESTQTQSALMIAALSVGPAKVTPLPDTLKLIHQGIGSSTNRTGEAISLTGSVLTYEGKPLANATLRVTSSNKLNAYDDLAATREPATNIIVQTDAEGNFRLPPLPDNQLYRLLISAPDSETLYFYGADVRRSPLEIRLLPAKELKPTQKYFVHARLVGPDNAPVVGAIVEPDGVADDFSTSWGGTQKFPERLVTGNDGQFIMERADSFTRLSVDIRAPGLATTKVWLPVTNNIQTVSLGVGASLTGRVLKGDKPLANVRVGVVGQDRSSEVFAGYYETTTDSEGRFVFKALPPSTGWWLYGLIDSLKPYGSLSPMPARSGNHGDVSDLKDLFVKPGIKLAGQVKTRNGEALPKDFKIGVGYATAWDHLQVTVDEEGRFEFTGLHTGKINVSLYTRSWKLANVNRSLDEWNPGSLTGLLLQDKSDLLLVAEPGERDYNNNWNGNGQLPPQDQADMRPLFGAEPSGPPNIWFAGKIVDDKTGDPIRKGTIVPGRKPPTATATPPAKPLLQRLTEPFKDKTIPWNERIYWEAKRKEDFTNGQFSLGMRPLSSIPVLRIEADGYEPTETEPMPDSQTNLVIRLKRGVGPRGFVLAPNGSSAKLAQVIFGATQEQFSLSGTELNAYGEKEVIVTTKADGKFSFDPRPGGQMLFLAHTTGWAQIKVEDLPGDGKITLEPWSGVTGILVDATGAPVPNMVLAVSMPQSFTRGDSFVNIQLRSTTDSKGRFSLSPIPSGKLNLVRLVPSGGNSWMNNQQTDFFAEPGKTNDLGKVTMDTPPKPTLFQEAKQKLGL